LISALKAEALCFPEIFISTYKIKWLHPIYSKRPNKCNKILFNDAVNCLEYIALVMDGWMDE